MRAALHAALSLCALAAAQVPDTPGPWPVRPIRATTAHVTCDIVDGVATVELALAVRNEGNAVGEAEWILPLPQGAVADGFTCRIGSGEPISGEVLDATSARRVYESIVRRRRDPGLLEFAGRGCLRARLFPIPAQGTAEVHIRWRQVLPELAGLVRWRQPVAVLGVAGRPPEQAVFTVNVKSSKPIRTALSPTPGTDVRLVDAQHVIASFEPAPNEPLPAELALYYGLSEEEFGLHVLAQREVSDDDGYFTLLISPRRDQDDAETPPRAVTFVLDVSGSMKGDKIDQARGAVRQFLRGLRPRDRFDVVPFSLEAEPFFGHTVPATPENVENALRRVADIEARGGTNLESALRRGLPDRGPEGDCVPMCVLLSDGLPTVGERSPTVLMDVAKALVTERDARIFVLGVGHDVHTLLLDGLADTGRGTRQYVRPGEDIEAEAADLLAKIGKPVMTDLVLEIPGAGVSRMTPARLPDLFAGSRLVVTGRYATPGATTVRLSGRVGEVMRDYVYEASFADVETGNGFVPKLWATRRVATLLDEIRRNGPADELLDEVRRLGTDFQIVTPYTSHLVVEEGLGVRVTGGPGRGPVGPGAPRPGAGGGPATGGPAGPTSPGPGGPATRGGAYRGPGDAVPPAHTALDLQEIGARLQHAGVLPKDASPADVERLARQVAAELQRSAEGLAGLSGRATGARAVDDSVYLARLVAAGDSARAGSDGAARIAELFVRRVGDKVFRLREGVWTDRSFDAEKTYTDVRRVEAFSDGYFALLRDVPDVARYLALSDRMKIVLGELLVEIVPPASEGDRPPEPTSRDRQASTGT